MTEAEMLAAIRKEHLKIDAPEGSTLHWDRAWIDPGPSPAGNGGPYAKVPVTCDDDDSIVIRVYPTKRVWRRLKGDA